MTDAADAPPVRPDGNMAMLSTGFAAWLARVDASVAFTTYQAGRLFLLGRRPDGSIRANERLIEQCQGLWTDGTMIWTSSKSLLWRFRNDIPAGTALPNGADRRFLPREGRSPPCLCQCDQSLRRRRRLA